MPVRPNWLIETYKVFVFRQKCCRRLSSSKLPVLCIHEDVLWKCLCCEFQRRGPTLQIPQTASPGDARKCQSKWASATTSYSSELFRGSFPSLSLSASSLLFNCLSLPFFSLHRWRCAYLSSAVSQCLWWSIRIADGEREGCLNAAWCSAKLRALKPSRHESSPVTAWCLPLQRTLSLGRKTPALIRPRNKESNYISTRSILLRCMNRLYSRAQIPKAQLSRFPAPTNESWLHFFGNKKIDGAGRAFLLMSLCFPTFFYMNWFRIRSYQLWIVIITVH